MIAEEVGTFPGGHQSLAVDPKFYILPKTPHITIGVSVNSADGHIVPNIPVVLGFLVVRSTQKDFDVL
jgi:hypothetical protein